jgi:Mitochondrial carrier protein
LLVHRAPYSPTRWSIRWTCKCTDHRTGVLLLITCRIKTKLQVQVKRKVINGEPVEIDPHHYESTFHAIQKIVEHEGISGLYSGFSGSLLGVASTNFAYFYWYSVVRQLYIAYKKSPSPTSTTAELSLGAVAGALAQLFTIPVAVITTRQQTQRRGEKKSFRETAKEVIDGEDGWTGLWRGLKASLVLVINPSITYGAYQRLREKLFPGRTALRPWEAFCESLSALANEAS